MTRQLRGEIPSSFTPNTIAVATTEFPTETASLSRATVSMETEIPALFQLFPNKLLEVFSPPEIKFNAA